MKKGEVEYPVPRHTDCEDNHCRICLDDSDKLGKFLDLKTGIDRVDHLGAYHSFLKNDGFNPETEWGWWSEEVFKKEHLDRYIQFRTGDIDEEKLADKAERIFKLKQITETDKNFKIEALINLVKGLLEKEEL